MADELCPNCGSAGLRWLAFSCGSRPRIGKPGATESVGCLRRQRDALRAERDELRRMPDAVLALEEPVETALRTEIAALKAELAKYTEPLTYEQAITICNDPNLNIITEGEVDDIDAALAACDESPWRSMDDPLLPKDGTNILLCGGANVSQGGWLTGAMQGAEDESCAGWWAVGCIENPTHWMPMPAAPEVKP